MKVYLRTFGCRANQYDSETVRAMVQRGGGVLVDRPEDADMAVFNSCAVTAEAEVDLRKQIRRAARKRPTLRTMVMGCAAALDRGTIAALPTVTHVVPGADYAAIAAGLSLDIDAAGAAASQTGTRGLLRVQDGCGEHCTFCATTLARGANRSRPVAELVREAQALAHAHAEIVITGVHIGTYGADIGSSLGALVQQLVHHVPRVRFRLSSVEATEVDGALRECLNDVDRMAPHIHAPLQSGADRVLRRMGRHWYTAREYAAAVRRILGQRAVFGLGADVIAGFPGETDDDHAATMALVDDLPFSYLHVFPYSPRPGTAAERLGHQLPASLIQDRARELRELSKRKAAQYVTTRAGGRADVIVLGGVAREGLTEDYLSVQISGTLAPRGARLPMYLRQGSSGRLEASPSNPASE